MLDGLGDGELGIGSREGGRVRWATLTWPLIIEGSDLEESLGVSLDDIFDVDSMETILVRVCLSSVYVCFWCFSLRPK
jgi:hypothetical protein